MWYSDIENYTFKCKKKYVAFYIFALSFYPMEESFSKITWMYVWEYKMSQIKRLKIKKKWIIFYVKTGYSFLSIMFIKTVNNLNTKLIKDMHNS